MSSKGSSELVAMLREEQKRLNQAIDAYADVASKDKIGVVELEVAQQQVGSSSRRLAALIRNPIWDAAHLALQPLLNTAVRIALDLDLFNVITLNPTTVDEIVTKTCADRNLIIRITRTLAASQIFDEIAPLIFVSTSLSNAFAHPVLTAWFKTMFDITVPRSYKIPSFLDQTSHSEPMSLSSYSASVFSEESIWDQLSANPSQFANFSTAMKLPDVRPPEYVPKYDFTSHLGAAPDSGITLIDIGGGHGHAIDTIIRDHPTLPGRFILQDQSGPVEQIKADRSRHVRFEPMVHDFFTPQPTAMRPRWFYIRACLHDWADKECVQILRHLHEAIADNPGSSILLQELVLPEMGAIQFDTLMDLNMMPFGGMERSESQWRELLGAANLEIKGITRAKLGHRCVMEVVVKNVETGNTGA